MRCGLPAVFLVLLAACGVVSSSGVSTTVSESEAWAVKAGVEANFEKAQTLARRSFSTASLDRGPFLIRLSCSQFSTKEIAISVSGSFTVESTSTRSVVDAVRRSWERAGWRVRSYEVPDETTYNTGQDGVRGYVGSLRVGSDVDSSGRSVVRVTIASESACLRIPDSLAKNAWPTQLDD